MVDPTTLALTAAKDLVTRLKEPIWKLSMEARMDAAVLASWSELLDEAIQHAARIPGVLKRLQEHSDSLEDLTVAVSEKTTPLEVTALIQQARDAHVRAGTQEKIGLLARAAAGALFGSEPFDIKQAFLKIVDEFQPAHVETMRLLDWKLDGGPLKDIRLFHFASQLDPKQRAQTPHPRAFPKTAVLVKIIEDILQASQKNDDERLAQAAPLVAQDIIGAGFLAPEVDELEWNNRQGYWAPKHDKRRYRLTPFAYRFLGFLQYRMG